MKTHSSDSEVYLGRKAGADLLTDIEYAKKSVKIVSPYLTASYVKELIKLQKKGVEVSVITADDIKEGDGNFSDLTHKDLIVQEKILNKQEKENREMGMKKSSLILLPILIWAFLPKLLSFTFIIINVIIYLVVFLNYYNKRIYSYKYHPVFTRLKVFFSHHSKSIEGKGDHLIHSKIYVIDEVVAYVGSVNYTYDGTIKNYESLVKIKDKNAVNNISKEVESLFNSNRLQKSIDDWGKQLYPEQIN